MLCFVRVTPNLSVSPALCLAETVSCVQWLTCESFPDLWLALGVNCDISLDQAVFPSSDGPVPTPGMYRVVALMCVHYNAVTPVVHTAPLYTGVRCPQHAVSHPHILKTVLYTRTAFSYLLILDGHPVFGVGHGGHSVQWATPSLARPHPSPDYWTLTTLVTYSTLACCCLLSLAHLDTRH